MSKISRKERERSRLRQDILSAATELFAELSYERTAVQQIADKAEISVGTIYNLFSGKEAIFNGLINMIMENLSMEIAEARSIEQSPSDRIRSVFRTYLDYCEKHISAMVVILNENPPGMKGVLIDFFEQQICLLEELYRRTIDAGELERKNPRLLAIITLGYIDSYAYMISRERGTATKDELLSLFDVTMLQS